VDVHDKPDLPTVNFSYVDGTEVSSLLSSSRCPGGRRLSAVEPACTPHGPPESDPVFLPCRHKEDEEEDWYYQTRLISYMISYQGVPILPAGTDPKKNWFLSRWPRRSDPVNLSRSC